MLPVFYTSNTWLIRFVVLYVTAKGWWNDNKGKGREHQEAVSRRFGVEVWQGRVCSSEPRSGGNPSSQFKCSTGKGGKGPTRNFSEGKSPSD